MEVADRIKYFRERLGWRQVDVATALQVSRPTVHQWERGMNQPRPANMRRLLDAFGVTYSEFYGPLKPVKPRKRKQ